MQSLFAANKSYLCSNCRRLWNACRMSNDLNGFIGGNSFRFKSSSNISIAASKNLKKPAKSINPDYNSVLFTKKGKGKQLSAIQIQKYSSLLNFLDNESEKTKNKKSRVSKKGNRKSKGLTTKGASESALKGVKWKGEVVKYEELEEIAGLFSSGKEGVFATDNFVVDLTSEKINAEKPKEELFVEEGLTLTRGELRQIRSILKDKQQKSELQRLKTLSEISDLRKSLKAYLNVCVFGNILDRGQSVLMYYRSKCLRERNKDLIIADIACYNIVLKGLAYLGKTRKIQELFHVMKSSNISPNLESYAYYLLSLSKSGKNNMLQHAKDVVKEMKIWNLDIDNIFNVCSISSRERNDFEKLLKAVIPGFVPKGPNFTSTYNCDLLENYKNIDSKTTPWPEEININFLRQCANEQLQLEIKSETQIKSISTEEVYNESRVTYQEKWKKLEEKWRKVLLKAFQEHLHTLQLQSNSISGMSMYPYLSCLNPEVYVEEMLKEIRFHAGSSEYYSPSTTYLYAELGRKIMFAYLRQCFLNDGSTKDFEQIYDKYLEYCCSPILMSKFTPRDYWQYLLAQHKHSCNTSLQSMMWPLHVQTGVGNFLYDVMLREIQLDFNITELKNKKFNAKNISHNEVPAFYTSYKAVGDLKYKREIRTHPKLIKLFQKANTETLPFATTILPMLSPPVPWISLEFGGFLLPKTEFVRLPLVAEKHMEFLKETPETDLFPSFDSLNTLSLCPWRVNERILDIAIHIFNNKGDPSLDIPIPQSQFPPLPQVKSATSRIERYKIHKQREAQKRVQAETYSLRCDCLYKLSIANHLRKRIFWFPNNMDFRGRVYPVPPHFSHLGSDLTRGLMLFATGQPLGPNGLDWIKIHLINLTGFKKKNSNEERLAFANEMLDEIIDSAERPLDGNKWWMTSDEPWQTLACCMEIVNAIRAPNPSEYVSSFPIHQDGSCNGLQHYAALGRDQHGAESVNLAPSDRPQDVYNVVAGLVEEERRKDAENGKEVALLLEGHITRKVVKQTVMTYVYGVTPYGARLQVQKRLKEVETFPQNMTSSAAAYVSQKIFFTIQQMFNSTRLIQDWFTDCAQIISKDFRKPVKWVTPLGFPVLQPYFRLTLKRGQTFYGWGGESNQLYVAQYQKPNVMKQKNAFPPNFIHSLDSSHMMLTALHCQKAGITFASVHDCFWTHANSVEIMNQICRQQFIMLHSKPILQQLSDYLVREYGDNVKGASDQAYADILSRELQKGTFELEKIRDSTYFFS